MASRNEYTTLMLAVIFLTYVLVIPLVVLLTRPLLTITCVTLLTTLILGNASFNMQFVEAARRYTNS